MSKLYIPLNKLVTYSVGFFMCVATKATNDKMLMSDSVPFFPDSEYLIKKRVSNDRYL